MQNNIKGAVFDLDGTLINTLTDLANACEFVIKKHNYEAHWSEEDYKHFVGNGMRKLIERAFRHTLTEEQTAAYLTEFKAYYAKTQLDHTAPYPGIPEQLKLLKEQGIRLAVVTNKAEEAAVAILNALLGENTFDVIIGQRDGLPTKPAPDGVLKALDAIGCTRDEVLYFGDSDVDILTARNAGVTSVGVTWGFRGRAELENAGADLILEQPEEIQKLFS